MSVSCLFVFSLFVLFFLIAPSQVTALSRRDTLFSVVYRHSRLPPLKRPHFSITVHCLAELAPRHVCVNLTFGRVVESRQRSNVTLGLVVGVWWRDETRIDTHIGDCSTVRDGMKKTGWLLTLVSSQLSRQ